MVEPIRVQRSRKKGWKMPDNTVYVGRPTPWGNLFNGPEPAETRVRWFREWLTQRLEGAPLFHPTINPHEIDNFLKNELEKLRGKNLACWCALDRPCHADVLLEKANS